MEKAAKQPSLPSWILGISLALFFVIFCFCLSLFIQTWTTSQVIGRVTALLTAPSKADNRDAIWNSAFTDLRLIGIRPESEDTLKHLTQVNHALINSDFLRAGKAFEVILKYSRFSLIELLGANKRAARKLSTFKKYLEFGAMLQENLARFESKLLDIHERSKAPIELYVLARQDLYEFVSLPPRVDFPRLNQCADLSFYEGGILMELPVIPEFPDNIIDGAEFKLRLENVGGEIKFSGKDAPIHFQNKIAEMVAASRQIASECGALRREQENAQFAATETRARIERASGYALRMNKSLLTSSLASAKVGINSTIIEKFRPLIKRINLHLGS